MDSGRHKVLVTDTIAPSGLAILEAADDIELDYRPGLKDQALLDAVAQTDALITRSGTAVTPELVNAGTRLRMHGEVKVDPVVQTINGMQSFICCWQAF